MINIGIIGGAGYTAGELLRLLVNHPQAHLEFVQSSSHAGVPVADVHLDLTGETELVFVKRMPTTPDLLFICSGHGRSRSFLEKHALPPKVKVIDLSSDFRLKAKADGFIYGLPELNRKRILRAKKIANPGCFATAIQLALLPLARQGLLAGDVHINAITGSTGAGQHPTPTSHFSWRNNNVSIYKPFSHQHLFEIQESLQALQPMFANDLHFLPVRGNFSKGIYASLYTNCELSQEQATSLYHDFYQSHPFVRITAQNPSLKQVINTNNCHLFLEKHGDKLLIISLIDNLIKGASGQAVQNMNLLFGLDECMGLRLKASAF
ncbi:MAG: N-acetyl-gamma-glutamyl-phosphate reductase [Bacteroidota bacterium]